MRRMLKELSFLCVSAVPFFVFSMQAMPYSGYYFTRPIADGIQGRIMGPNGDYGLIRYEDIAWLNEAFIERFLMAGVHNTYLPTNVSSVISAKWFPQPNGYVDKNAVATNAVIGTEPHDTDYAKELIGLTNVYIRTYSIRSGMLIGKSVITNMFSSMLMASRISPNVTETIPYRDVEIVDNSYYNGWGFDDELNPLTPVSVSEHETDSVTNLSQALYHISKSQRKWKEKSAYFPYEYYAETQEGRSANAPDSSETISSEEKFTTNKFNVKLSFNITTNAWFRGGESPGWYKSGPSVYAVVKCEYKSEKQWSCYGYTTDSTYSESTNQTTNVYVIVKAGEATYSHMTNEISMVWSADIDSSELYKDCYDMLGPEFEPSWVTGLSVADPVAPTLNPSLIGVNFTTWTSMVPYHQDQSDMRNFSASAGRENYEKRSLTASLSYAFIVIDLDLNTKLE